jgi:hypothetical protein
MNPSIAEGKAVASAPGFGVEEEEYMLAPASDDRPSPGTSQGEAPKKGQTSLKSPKTIKDAIITDSRDKNSSTLPRPSSQPSRLPNYTRDNEAIQPNSDSLDSDSEYATAWWDRGLARHLSARHLREMHPEDADFINKFFSVPPSRPEGSSSHSGPSGAGNDSSSSHGNTPLLSRSPVQTRERRQSHLPQIASQINPRSEVVMPRWQPDAEVTFCPICRTQFSKYPLFLPLRMRYLTRY